MRHHGGKKLDENRSRLAQSEGKVGFLIRTVSGKCRPDLVGEIVNLRDGDVEAQPFDVLLDIMERAMRGLAQIEGVIT